MLNTIAAWLLLFAFYIGFALPVYRDFIKRLDHKLHGWAAAGLLLPYLLAVNLQPDAGELLPFAIYLFLPAALMRLRPQKNRPFDIFHILTVLSIWIPIELDLFVMLFNPLFPFISLQNRLGGIHILPQATAELYPGVALPVDMLTGAALTLFLFTVSHPLKDAGYTFRIKHQDVQAALVGLAAYAVPALPLGIGLGFLAFSSKKPDLVEAMTMVAAGYFFVALIEEILFRGIIQNLLEKRLKKPIYALFPAAVIFALSHINNPTPGFPIPNWAYVLMALPAGLIYGWVWIRTRKVTVSAITHALVNFIWWLFFMP